ncbi:MAG: PAS domain-containing protein [Deferribacteraceae bacterium]|jgi:PAS domain S-box-containing protein|nr:PAS domain-containing protein [Deferribacteraceae bacterium]
MSFSRLFAAGIAITFALLTAYAVLIRETAAFREGQNRAVIENEHRVELLKDRINRLFYSFALCLRDIGGQIESRNMQAEEIHNLLTIAALGNEDISALNLEDAVALPEDIGRFNFYLNPASTGKTGRSYIYELTLSDARRLQLLLEPDFLSKDAYFTYFQGKAAIAVRDAENGYILGGSPKALNKPRNILTINFEGGSLDIYSKLEEQEFTPLKITIISKLLLALLVSLFLYIALRKLQYLLYSRDVYKLIFNNAYSGLALINPTDGDITYINPRGELLLGLTNWKAGGKNSFFEFIAEEYRESVVKELNSSDCVHSQQVILKISESRIWVILFIKSISSQAALASFSDVNRYAVEYFANLKEITETSFILNSFPSAFLLTDREGAVLRANISAQIMLGLTSRQILGRGYSALFPPQTAEEMQRQDMDILTGKMKYYTGVSRFNIGGQVEKMYRISKIPNLNINGEIIGVLGIYELVAEKEAKYDEMLNKLEKVKQAGRSESSIDGKNYPFFRRSAIERKKGERFRSLRTSGIGSIYNYLCSYIDMRCKLITSYIQSSNIDSNSSAIVLKALSQIANLYSFERLFSFNEGSKLFSPSKMLSSIIEREKFPAIICEDELSKLVQLTAYVEEIEALFTKLMRRIAELWGEFRLTITADSLDYQILFTFKPNFKQDGQLFSDDVFENDAVFLYSRLFIREILGEMWQTREEKGEFSIILSFAV